MELDLFGELEQSLAPKPEPAPVELSPADAFLAKNRAALVEREEAVNKVQPVEDMAAREEKRTPADQDDSGPTTRAQIDAWTRFRKANPDSTMPLREWKLTEARKHLPAGMKDLQQANQLGSMKGNLEWENGQKDGKVIFTPDEAGRWEVSNTPQLPPKPNPEYVIGYDPASPAQEPTIYKINGDEPPEKMDLPIVDGHHSISSRLDDGTILVHIKPELPGFESLPTNELKDWTLKGAAPRETPKTIDWGHIPEATDFFDEPKDDGQAGLFDLVMNTDHKVEFRYIDPADKTLAELEHEAKPFEERDYATRNYNPGDPGYEEMLALASNKAVQTDKTTTFEGVPETSKELLESPEFKEYFNVKVEEEKPWPDYTNNRFYREKEEGAITVTVSPDNSRNPDKFSHIFREHSTGALPTGNPHQIHIKVLGEPTAQKRHRHMTLPGTKFSHIYDPSQADKADFLSLIHENAPAQMFTCALRMDVFFYFARPASHYGTGKNAGVLKESAPLWKIAKPDRDNLDKFVLDSMKGIYFKDDSVVCAGEIIKKYDENPRTEIVITVL